MPDRLSVIIPCYRQAAKLPRAVESVLAQNDPHIEIIIINDGCPEDSAAVAERLAATHACIKVIHQRNQGVSAARNTGLRHASGTWIQFLDSDDWLRGGMYEACREALLAHPDADLICTGQEIHNAQGALIQRMPAPDPRDMPDGLLQRNLMSIHMPWVRRSRLLGIDGFDPTLTHCEDWDLWIRLARSNIKAVRIDGHHAIYCRHEAGKASSASMDYGAMIKGAGAMLSRHHQDPGHLASAMRSARLDFFQLSVKPVLDHQLRQRDYVGYLCTLLGSIRASGGDFAPARNDLGHRWRSVRSRVVRH